MFKRLFKNNKKALETEIQELKGKLAEKQAIIFNLEMQVEKSVQSRKLGQSDVLYELKDLSNVGLNELRKTKCNFDVFDATEEGEPQKWAVVTSYCQYGGCDIPVYFGDEISARIYALIRTKLGDKPSTNSLCDECRVDYMNDVI